MTTTLPPLDLLKQTHAFPTIYTFKVIGHAADNFLARAVASARAAAHLDEDPQFVLRQSEHGKHVSVTLNIPTPTAERVLEIYKELAQLKGLVLLM